MARFQTHEHIVLELIDSAFRTVKTTPMNLGGISGDEGGIGDPPGGFIGQLRQRKVAYDSTEAATLFTPASGRSLIDNLNHIRYRIGFVEDMIESGILLVDEWDGSPSVNNVNHITFSGGATVVDLTNGHVMVVVSGGGGSALTVQEYGGIPTVNNVDKIIFSGADVFDLGNGDVLVAFSGGGTNLIIEDLTGQVPDTHFDLARTAESGTLRLYYNGIRQPPDTYYTMDPDGQGFTTDFVTYSGDAIVVDYNESNGDTETIYHEFGEIAVAGQTNVVAGTVEDTLELEAGYWNEITTTPASNKVTISSEIPDRRRVAPIFSDFLVANENETGYTFLTPFTYTPISNGIFGSYTGETNHPGWMGFNCGTNANSGGTLASNLNAIRDVGNNYFEFIFYVTQSTNLVVYAGIHKSSSATAPTDGIWFNIAATTLSGKCAASSSTTTTASTYTISTATWYRGRLVVNTAASSVDFYLYDESGTLLWNDSVSSNIPATTLSPVQMVAAKTTSSGSQTEIVRLDWIAFWSTKLLTR